ncbi:endo alpha-1,4 polygalactosaminidase [Deferribacteraceae bacterium V6Fe1]|nr:endo alpha-1,4 polygalactosaminidase [Deferribacteraceae bacterium V6Fe1]
MKPSCFNKIIILFFIMLVSNSFALNVAFYYESNIPDEILKLYDWVVVQSDNTDNFAVTKYGDKLFAYISVNEIHNEEINDITKRWVIGVNKSWNTPIADIRNENYRAYLLSKITALYDKGYRNFFLDTLDSYKIIAKQPQWKEYEAKLADFIISIKTKFPTSKILLNRGFEIIDNVHSYIDGVAAESLFFGYDGQKYFNVSQENRNYLIDKLNKVKSYNKPVIVIDYLRPENFHLAKKVAKDIKSLGFIPYITDNDLSVIGISNLEIYKRKILIIYKSKNDIALSDAHRLIQMPLEYLGYKAEFKTPEEAVKEKYTFDKYAGIIIFSESYILEDYENFYKWVLTQINTNIKILFLQNFGFPFENKYLSSFGMDIQENLSPAFENLQYLYTDSITNYETELPEIVSSSQMVSIKSGTPLVILKNSHSQIHHPIAITDWGGYVLEEFFIKEFANNIKWLVNPFEFIKKALRLGDFPAPDFTTENGKRVLISHIDGDGSVSLSEIDPGKLASEVIRDEVLKKYEIPIGVSFVEGEIMPYGAYPQFSKKAIDVAKSIYLLPNVEPASHSFSHPFKWLTSYALSTQDAVIPDEYSIDIPNYTFDLKREIVGSIQNLSKISPQNKQIKVFYWTGDCLPPEEGLKLIYQNNYLNINNGDTSITNERPFLSLVAPAGLKRGRFYQIYTGAQNENVYTNGFSQNYWRYKKVIETFELTDKPYRLKPIDIYYHFYSGAKLASLNAVKDVYKWALKQDIIPMKVSEYILKVLDFYETVIAKEDNAWLIQTDKHLRTLRVSTNYGYPDLKLSQGVLGFYDYNGQRYIHLNGGGFYKLVFTNATPQTPYLVQTNGRIIDSDNGRYKINGYMPIDVKLANISNCRIRTYDKYSVKNGIIHFKSKGVEFQVECK